MFFLPVFSVSKQVLVDLFQLDLSNIPIEKKICFRIAKFKIFCLKILKTFLVEPSNSNSGSALNLCGVFLHKGRPYLVLAGEEWFPEVELGKNAAT